MANQIVVINVSTTNAPTPNTLQQTGAFVSQGGTTAAAQSLTQYATLALLQAALSAAKALTSLVWSASVVTGTTTAPHGWGVGDVIPITIAGETPAGYNGNFNATVTGASTFTYPLASNPGSATVQGTVLLGDESELNAMAITYFAQQGAPAINVLELGEGTVNAGVTALSTWMNNNMPQGSTPTVYSFLVPREWDNNASFIALAGQWAANNSKVYFFVTTILANRAVYAGIKSVLPQIEAPGIPATEFSLAADQAVTLAYAPSSTIKVPPLRYAFVNGVTPYPLPQNQGVFTQLAAANVGWIGTGAEGGLSNKIIVGGKMGDGNPFNYWYSADWAQINLDLNLANEIINGSNNPLAPLYYDQNGINRLQNRALQVCRTGVGYGLATGTVVGTKLPVSQFVANFYAGNYVGQLVVNAEPFIVYSHENPNDYAQGRYAGFSCVWTPTTGFQQIIFLLNVTNLIVP